MLDQSSTTDPAGNGVIMGQQEGTKQFSGVTVDEEKFTESKKDTPRPCSGDERS